MVDIQKFKCPVCGCTEVVTLPHVRYPDGKTPYPFYVTESRLSNGDWWKTVICAADGCHNEYSIKSKYGPKGELKEGDA